jgi:DNA-binding XRE family transcriptional regulator
MDTEVQMKQCSLSEARKNKAVSQEIVAKAIGIDRAAYSNIETGKRRASPKIAAKLAQFFHPIIKEVDILYPERGMSNVTQVTKVAKQVKDHASNHTVAVTSR